MKSQWEAVSAQHFGRSTEAKAKQAYFRIFVITNERQSALKRLHRQTRNALASFRHLQSSLDQHFLLVCVVEPELHLSFHFGCTRDLCACKMS